MGEFMQKRFTPLRGRKDVGKHYFPLFWHIVAVRASYYLFEINRNGRSLENFPEKLLGIAIVHGRLSNLKLRQRFPFCLGYVKDVDALEADQCLLFLFLRPRLFKRVGGYIRGGAFFRTDSPLYLFEKGREDHNPLLAFLYGPA